MSTPTSYRTKYELYNVDFQRGDVRHFFRESDRTAYFTGLGTVNSGTTTSYIRQNEDFTVNKTWADVREANYVRYDNNDGAGWRYAYVDKLEVVSTSATKLYITEDAWQNNMFNFSIHGTRIRGHVDRLTPAYLRKWSYTSEPISTTPVADTVNYTHRDFQYVWYVFSQPVTAFAEDEPPTTILTEGLQYLLFPVPANLTDLTYIFGTVAVNIDHSVFDFLDNNAYLVNKFYSSVTPLGCQVNYNGNNTFVISETPGASIIRRIMSGESGTSYQVIEYKPSSQFNWGNNTQSVKTTMSMPNQTYFNGTLSPANIRNINAETKLFESPYTHHYYGVGNAGMEIYNELIQPTTGKINVRYALLPSASGCTIIQQYPSGYAEATDRVKVVEEMLSIPGPTRKDIENTFIAANNYKMQSQSINMILSGLMGAVMQPVSKFANIAEAQNANTVAYGVAKYAATRADLKNAPDHISLNGSPGINVLTDSQFPYVITFRPKSDELDRIYSYFYTYGYTINEWQEKTQATLRSRYYFDYYLMADDVHVDIDDSNTARQQMQEDLQKGVTFWHWNPTNNDIQHRYENLEMTIYQSQQ